jgi:hypothetical protein
MRSSTFQTVKIEIAGLDVELAADEVVTAALHTKLSNFVVDGPEAAPAEWRPDIAIAIDGHAPDFSPDFELDEAQTPTLRVVDPDRRVELGGAVRGMLEFGHRTGIGVLEAPHHLGEVDALMRLALSILLPSRGALLLHASAVVLGADSAGATLAGGGRGASIFTGASGHGKSTAARGLGRALCDELVALHVSPRGLEVSGTPYWHGVSERLPVEHLVCLEKAQGARSAEGRTERLRGAQALSKLQPHVARYVHLPAIDREIFSLLATACAAQPLLHAVCPVGDLYLPYLREAITSSTSLQGE